MFDLGFTRVSFRFGFKDCLVFGLMGVSLGLRFKDFFGFGV